MSAPYRYQTLTGTLEVRLLRLLPGHQQDPIQFELQHAVLSEALDYEAVSYTWLRDKDVSCGLYYETLSTAGGVFNLTPSCFEALHRFRDEGKSRLLWIDAICIDQENITERGQQVLLMGQIYQSAKQVLIWLGEEEPGDNDAMQCFERMHGFFKTHTPNRHRLSEAEIWQTETEHTIPEPESTSWVNMTNFMWRKWFTRGWIIQEIAMAKTAVVFCGALTMRWEVFSEVAQQVSLQGLRPFLRSTRVQELPNPVFWIQWLKDLRAQGEAMSLVQTLAFSRSFDVGNRRDRIYSLLSFVKEEERIQPDYKISVADLFGKVVADAMLRTHSLDLLQYVQGTAPEQNADIPSWVGTWSLRRLPFSEFIPFLSAGTNKEPVFDISRDHRCLTVKGIIVDEIAATSPSFTFFNLDGRYSYRTARWKLSKDYIIWAKDVEAVAKPAQRKGHPIEEAVGRVIVADTMSRDQRDRSVQYAGFYDSWKRMHYLLCDHFANGGGTYNFPAQIINLLPRVNEYAAALSEATNYRVVCRTRNRSLGLAPVGSREGDKICIFWGSKTPFVVRKGVDGSYQFVGECFVDGLMKGEIFEALDPTPLTTSIVLR